MSSLRRRAIVVQRARSTERSSTGGRVSARTTAAGVGRVGEQAQPGDHVAHLRPLEEGAGAGEPERDAPLLERGGDASARLAPARGTAITQISLGLHLAGGEQLLDVARDRLGLGPLVRAAPEADPRRRPGSLARRDVGSVGRGRAPPRAPRSRDRRRSASGWLQRRPRSASGWPSVNQAPGRRRSREGADAWLVVAGETGAVLGRQRVERRDQRAPRAASSSSSTIRCGKRSASVARDVGRSPSSLLSSSTRRCRPWLPPRAASRRGARRSRRTRARGGARSRSRRALASRSRRRPSAEPLGRHAART